jgi:hypothetical protein
MRTTGRVWKALTEGERLSALEYAQWMNEKRWKGEQHG